MIILAGHRMEDYGNGLRCEGGRTWRYLLEHRDQWIVGRLGLAHNDAGTIGLSSGEIESLNKYLDVHMSVLRY